MSRYLIKAEGSELLSNHPDDSSVLFPPKQTSPQSRKSLMEPGWGSVCVCKPAPKQGNGSIQDGLRDEDEVKQEYSEDQHTSKNKCCWVCDVTSKLTFLLKSCCVCRRSSSSNSAEPWSFCRGDGVQEAFKVSEADADR